MTNEKHVPMDMESAFIWMAQNDGVSRKNEALIFKFSTLGRSISSISLFQMQILLGFVANVTNISREHIKFFPLYGKLSIPEFGSFKELYKSCCSNSPFYTRGN